MKTKTQPPVFLQKEPDQKRTKHETQTDFDLFKVKLSELLGHKLFPSEIDVQVHGFLDSAGNNIPMGTKLLVMGSICRKTGKKFCDGSADHGDNGVFQWVQLPDGRRTEILNQGQAY
jgi:hypothetical protein